MDCFGIFLQEGTLGKRMFFVSATKQIRYGLFAVVLEGIGSCIQKIGITEAGMDE